MARRVARSQESTRDPTGETAPRGWVFDETFSPRYELPMLQTAPIALRVLYRPLPAWLQMAIEVHRRRREYDAIVTWSERLSLALTMLQRFTARRPPHIAMMYWFSKRNVALPLRLFGGSLAGLVTWTTVQRRFVTERLGFPPERVALVKYPVDTVFWRPRSTAIDTICSAGSEMRDYGTLFEALRGSGLRCHVAADHARINRPLLRHARVDLEQLSQASSREVTVGRLSPTELRTLYARSRFVVVPILPSDTDNGVSVIVEAMAMGKPVICSRTQGQVDVIQDGVTGILVPVGDAAALREAMLGLWNDPERAAEMGARARAYAERHHAIEKFSRDVRTAVAALADGQGVLPDGSLSTTVTTVTV
jgi:glycosyltransferase involved in cell wall biosynthesis